MSFAALDPDGVVGYAGELASAAEEFVNSAARIAAILSSVDSDELGGAPEGILNEMSGSSQDLGVLLVDKATAMLAAASGLDFGAMGPFGGVPIGTPIGVGGPLLVGSVTSEVLDFLVGDIFRFWNGGDDDFPVGKSAAKYAFLARTANWMRLGGGTNALQKFPVFNTGLFGKGAANLANRLGATRLGAFLSEPVVASDIAAIGRSTFRGGPSAMLRATTATKFFRGLGIAGSAFSTGMGVYNLAQQGNPITAFQNDPSGYASDVAETVFSASTTAFLVAPNPVTAGIAVATGVVWAGTEIWDHWDEISDFAGKAWDTAGDVADFMYHNVPIAPLVPIPPAVLVNAADAVWDAGVEVMGGVAETVVEGVGDIAEGVGDIAEGVVDSVGDVAEGVVDGAGDLAKGALGKIGGLFG